MNENNNLVSMKQNIYLKITMILHVEYTQFCQNHVQGYKNTPSNASIAF